MWWQLSFIAEDKNGLWVSVIMGLLLACLTGLMVCMWWDLGFLRTTGLHSTPSQLDGVRGYGMWPLDRIQLSTSWGFSSMTLASSIPYPPNWIQVGWPVPDSFEIELAYCLSSSRLFIHPQVAMWHLFLLSLMLPCFVSCLEKQKPVLNNLVWNLRLP